MSNLKNTALYAEEALLAVFLLLSICQAMDYAYSYFFYIQNAQKLLAAVDKGLRLWYNI